MSTLFCMDEKIDEPAVNPTKTLFKACKGTPHPELVAFLIDGGAQVDEIIEGEKCTTLLMLVAREEKDNTIENHKKVVRLLAQNANPAHKAEALKCAVNNNRWGALEVLQEQEATLLDEDIADELNLAFQDAQEFASRVVNDTVDGTKKLYTNLEKMALETKDYVVEAFQEEKKPHYPPSISQESHELPVVIVAGNDDLSSCHRRRHRKTTNDNADEKKDKAPYLACRQLPVAPNTHPLFY